MMFSGSICNHSQFIRSSFWKKRLTYIYDEKLNMGKVYIETLLQELSAAKKN